MASSEAKIVAGRVGRSIFRGLLKEIRVMASGHNCIWLHESLDSRKMGWKWFPGGELRSLPTQFDVLEEILGIKNWRSRAVLAELREQRHDTPFTREELSGIARGVFKGKKGCPVLEEDFEDGFRALRAIADQKRKTECSSWHCAGSVTVRAMSCYDPEDSKKRGSHLFAYRVTVRNEGTEPLKLVGRHWYIIDANGNLACELPEAARKLSTLPPEIKAGQGLEYYSGVDLSTDYGKMSGFLHLHWALCPFDGKALEPSTVEWRGRKPQTSMPAITGVLPFT